MNRLRKGMIYFCTAILICLMLSIFLRAFTRLILVKQMGMKNKFTSIVLFDNVELQKTQKDSIEEDDQTFAAIETDWEKMYPFDDSKGNTSAAKYVRSADSSLGSKLGNIAASLTSAIDTYTSKNLIGYDNFIKLHEAYQNMIDWDIKNTNDSSVNIIHMKNGYLTYAEKAVSDADITEMADSVADFDTFLEEKGIDFYYMNAGSKVDPDDKQLSAVSMLNENTNENADKLLAALEARGVKNVDMRKLMKEDNLDWYGSYYVTDHHWTTRMGLWCASKIASILNEEAGFEYDMKLFDESSYDITTYEDFWFGGQARALKLVDCKREAYDFIIPKFETYFEVSIPSRAYYETGDYEEAVIDSELFEAIKGYEDTDFLTEGDPYHIPVWKNDALGTIKNSAAQDNENKKILFLQDSFGWYSGTFIACDTGEVDLIHPMTFDGSIREYINQTEPDVVIMLYCERNIKAIDWSTHQSSFDLR